MKKRPELITRSGKSNILLKNFLNNLRENDLHYENTKITQCVFLGVLKLKPVPSVFSSTNLTTNRNSEIEDKPRKVIKRPIRTPNKVYTKHNINKVISGKIRKKNPEKIKALVKKVPSKKSHLIKVKFSMNKKLMDSSEEKSLESSLHIKNQSEINKSMQFNPVQNLFNKMKGKMDTTHGQNKYQNEKEKFLDSFASDSAGNSFSTTGVPRKSKSPRNKSFICEIDSGSSKNTSFTDIQTKISHFRSESPDTIRKLFAENNPTEDIIMIETDSFPLKQKERTSPRFRKISIMEGNKSKSKKSLDKVSKSLGSKQLYSKENSFDNLETDIIVIPDDENSQTFTSEKVASDCDIVFVSETKLNNNTLNHQNVSSSLSSDLNASSNSVICQEKNHDSPSMKNNVDTDVDIQIISEIPTKNQKTKSFENLNTNNQGDGSGGEVIIIDGNSPQKPKSKRSRLLPAPIPSIFLQSPRLLRSELSQKNIRKEVERPLRSKSLPKLQKTESIKLDKSINQKQPGSPKKYKYQSISDEDTIFVSEEIISPNQGDKPSLKLIIRQKKRSDVSPIDKQKKQTRNDKQITDTTIDIQQTAPKLHTAKIKDVTRRKKNDKLPYDDLDLTKHTSDDQDKVVQKLIQDLTDDDVVEIPLTDKKIPTIVNKKTLNVTDSSTPTPTSIPVIDLEEETLSIHEISSPKKKLNLCDGITLVDNDDNQQFSPRLLRSNQIKESTIVNCVSSTLKSTSVHESVILDHSVTPQNNSDHLSGKVEVIQLTDDITFSTSKVFKTDITHSAKKDKTKTLTEANSNIKNESNKETVPDFPKTRALRSNKFIKQEVSDDTNESSSNNDESSNGIILVPEETSKSNTPEIIPTSNKIKTKDVFRSSSKSEVMIINDTELEFSSPRTLRSVKLIDDVGEENEESIRANSNQKSVSKNKRINGNEQKISKLDTKELHRASSEENSSKTSPKLSDEQCVLTSTNTADETDVQNETIRLLRFNNKVKQVNLITHAKDNINQIPVVPDEIMGKKIPESCENITSKVNMQSKRSRLRSSKLKQVNHEYLNSVDSLLSTEKTEENPTIIEVQKQAEVNSSFILKNDECSTIVPPIKKIVKSKIKNRSRFDNSSSKIINLRLLRPKLSEESIRDQTIVQNSNERLLPSNYHPEIANHKNESAPLPEDEPKSETQEEFNLIGRKNNTTLPKRKTKKPKYKQMILKQLRSNSKVRDLPTQEMKNYQVSNGEEETMAMIVTENFYGPSPDIQSKNTPDIEPVKKEIKKKDLNKSSLTSNDHSSFENESAILAEDELKFETLDESNLIDVKNSILPKRKAKKAKCKNQKLKQLRSNSKVRDLSTPEMKNNKETSEEKKPMEIIATNNFYGSIQSEKTHIKPVKKEFKKKNKLKTNKLQKQKLKVTVKKGKQNVNKTEVKLDTKKVKIPNKSINHVKLNQKQEKIIGINSKAPSVQTESNSSGILKKPSKTLKKVISTKIAKKKFAKRTDATKITKCFKGTTENNLLNNLKTEISEPIVEKNVSKPTHDEANQNNDTEKMKGDITKKKRSYTKQIKTSSQQKQTTEKNKIVSETVLVENEKTVSQKKKVGRPKKKLSDVPSPNTNLSTLVSQQKQPNDNNTIVPETVVVENNKMVLQKKKVGRPKKEVQDIPVPNTNLNTGTQPKKSGKPKKNSLDQVKSTQNKVTKVPPNIHKNDSTEVVLKVPEKFVGSKKKKVSFATHETVAAENPSENVQKSIENSVSSIPPNIECNLGKISKKGILQNVLMKKKIHKAERVKKEVNKPLKLLKQRKQKKKSSDTFDSIQIAEIVNSIQAIEISEENKEDIRTDNTPQKTTGIQMDATNEKSWIDITPVPKKRKGRTKKFNDTIEKLDSKALKRKHSQMSVTQLKTPVKKLLYKEIPKKLKKLTAKNNPEVHSTINESIESVISQSFDDKKDITVFDFDEDEAEEPVQLRFKEQKQTSRILKGNKNKPQDLNSDTESRNIDASQKKSHLKSSTKQATILEMFEKVVTKQKEALAKPLFEDSSKSSEETPQSSSRRQPSTAEGKHSTKKGTTQMLPPPPPQRASIKDEDYEDEDFSDDDSRAEWIPEEYAEYKYKYSAKKLKLMIFKCKICLMVLPNYHKLMKHKQIHLNADNPYECKQCKETFKNVDDLVAHLKIHKGEHPYKCSKCNEGFWTKKEYDSHRPIHVLRKVKDAPKKYQCDVCGKAFVKVCDMDRHTRVHTGEKPYICNICCKGFQQSHNLSKHLITHLNIKPYSCEICNKSFSRQDVLARHVLTHAIEKPFKCSLCPKNFIRESQLNMHTKHEHSKITTKDQSDGTAQDNSSNKKSRKKIKIEKTEPDQ